jgi:hypothetical protein
VLEKNSSSLILRQTALQISFLRWLAGAGLRVGGCGPCDIWLAGLVGGQASDHINCLGRDSYCEETFSWSPKALPWVATFKFGLCMQGFIEQPRADQQHLRALWCRY